MCDVTKYFGGVLALDRVSFDLAPGEVLGIIGPNGSGKTTLVNVITGFVRPDAGDVFFKDQKITGLPHRIYESVPHLSFTKLKEWLNLDPGHRLSSSGLGLNEINDLTRKDTDVHYLSPFSID